MTEPTPTPTPTPTGRNSRQKVGLLGAGALLGATGLAAAVMSLGGIASAQDSTLDSEPAAETEIDVNDEAVDSEVDEKTMADFEAAWEEFDQCLVDNGLDEGDEFDVDDKFEEFDETGVMVTGDGSFTVADFGEGDGTVTVTKVGDEITVTADGDVSTEEFTEEDIEAEMEAFDEEWEQAMAACEDSLPKDMFDDEFMFEDGMMFGHWDD